MYLMLLIFFLTLFIAAWKIIQAWLPAAAVKKIKFVKKNSIGEFITTDQRLVAWGGEDTWVYEFVEEEEKYETIEDHHANGDIHVNGFSSDSSEKNSPMVEDVDQPIVQNSHNHLESRSSMMSTTSSISFMEDNQNSKFDIWQHICR